MQKISNFKFQINFKSQISIFHRSLVAGRGLLVVGLCCWEPAVEHYSGCFKLRISEHYGRGCKPRPALRGCKPVRQWEPCPAVGTPSGSGNPVRQWEP
ncbi:MAG: hypothetical protein DRI57_30980, partial [Deltaproteobacteria bacterium]